MLDISRRRAALLLAGFAAPAAPAIAQLNPSQFRPGPQGPEGALMRETIWRIPVRSRRDRTDMVMLECTLFRPPTNQRVPWVMINHGQSGSTEARRQMPRQRMPNAAAVFVRAGWGVLLPVRRGFGNSEGEFLAGAGSCDQPDMVNNADTAANDIQNVMTWARENMAFLNHDRIVLAGQSAGGFGAMAAMGRRLPGVRGTLNFAGGLRTGNPAGGYCDGWQDALVRAFGTLGQRAAGMYSLWFYAPNDSFFGGALARRMRQAYVQAGGFADLQEPRYDGADGHALFGADGHVHLWREPALRFMKDSLL